MATTVTNPASFGNLERQPEQVATDIDYLAIQRSAEFAVLRSRLRRFVFPMTAVFFGWYLAYVLLAAYAHGLMSHRISGEITVGLVLGVLQFGSTILIMVGYLRYARSTIDPQVAVIRDRIGAGQR